jgi:hypothetical protein
MKAWLKHGFGLLAGLVFSCAAPADEPAPIEDRDAFEKQYVECFKSEWKDKCLSTLFLIHLDSGFEDANKILNQLENMQDTLGCLPYDVHIVDKVIRGEVFDSRTYLIECSNRNFVGSQVIFRRTKGQWHVFAIHFGNEDEFLQKILKPRTN